jgi:hypothetical protein
MALENLLNEDARQMLGYSDNTEFPDHDRDPVVNRRDRGVGILYDFAHAGVYDPSAVTDAQAPGTSQALSIEAPRRRIESSGLDTLAMRSAITASAGLA